MASIRKRFSKVFLLFLVIFLATNQKTHAAANSTLYFSQSDVNTAVTTISATNGTPFTLNPTINTGANHVSVVHLAITFDASKLALSAITPSSTFATVEAAASINNSAGTATIDLSVGNANPSANGTFSVATFSFNPIATGSAQIAFTGAAGTSGAAADGEIGNVVTGTTPATATVANANTVTVYRFYCLLTGDHFYTADESEKNELISDHADIWKYEGIAYSAYSSSQSGTTPVYRFFNLLNGQHFYTSDESEKDGLVSNYSNLWQYEGIAYYAYTSSQSGTTAVYRFFSLLNGQHFYTSDESEKDGLVSNYSNLWQYEGIAYYTQ